MAKRSSTVTNITDALRCARKVATGKTCTMKELRSTVTLLHNAYKARQASLREQMSRVQFLENFISQMK